MTVDEWKQVSFALASAWSAAEGDGQIPTKLRRLLEAEGWKDEPWDEHWVYEEDEYHSCKVCDP